MQGEEDLVRTQKDFEEGKHMSEGMWAYVQFLGYKTLFFKQPLPPFVYYPDTKPENWVKQGQSNSVTSFHSDYFTLICMVNTPP